jgi:hypothetical protein
MTVTDYALMEQMNRTAAALARTRTCVNLDFCMPRARGYCTKEPYKGAYHIGIDPRLEIGIMYTVFLHETAHAYIHARGLQPQDHEAAARQIGGTWARWIAPRKPTDRAECMEWLERLRSYHWRVTA